MSPISANMKFKNNAGDLGQMVDKENADFAHDVRLERRWKRRYAASQNFKPIYCSNKASKKTVNNGIGQMDNECFLNGIGRFADSNGNVATGIEDDDDDDDDNDMDPEYKTFLENLRDDGKSYVLEVAVNNELSIFFKYEKDDWSCDDGHVLENAETMNDHPKRENMKTERILRSDSNAETMNDHPKRENMKTERILRSDSRREKAESLRILGDVLRKENTESPRTLRDISHRESIETQNLRDVPVKKGKRPAVKKSLKRETVDPVPVSCRARGRSRKRPTPVALHSAKCQCSHDMKSDMVDESYRVFLSCLKKAGGNVVFAHRSGKQVIYEEDKESSSCSEIIVMGDDPFCDGNYTPFVASKSYHSFMDEDVLGCTRSSGRSNHSQFRDKLIDILKKPYDPKEHDNLWHKVSRQTPVQRHIDLRSGRTKTYSSGIGGKSYLDQYKDLAMKIDLVQCDRQKVLNLLRGFFYWLENLAHAGAFQPWLDSSSVMVLPGP